jgi:hypothetical protein
MFKNNKIEDAIVSVLESLFEVPICFYDIQFKDNKLGITRSKAEAINRVKYHLGKKTGISVRKPIFDKKKTFKTLIEKAEKMLLDVLSIEIDMTSKLIIPDKDECTGPLLPDIERISDHEMLRNQEFEREMMGREDLKEKEKVAQYEEWPTKYRGFIEKSKKDSREVEKNHEFNLINEINAGFWEFSTGMNSIIYHMVKIIQAMRKKRIEEKSCLDLDTMDVAYLLHLLTLKPEEADRLAKKINFNSFNRFIVDNQFYVHDNKIIFKKIHASLEIGEISSIKEAVSKFNLESKTARILHELEYIFKENRNHFYERPVPINNNDLEFWLDLFLTRKLEDFTKKYKTMGFKDGLLNVRKQLQPLIDKNFNECWNVYSLIALDEGREKEHKAKGMLLLVRPWEEAIRKSELEFIYHRPTLKFIWNKEKIPNPKNAEILSNRIVKSINDTNIHYNTVSKGFIYKGVGSIRIKENLEKNEKVLRAENYVKSKIPKTKKGKMMDFDAILQEHLELCSFKSDYSEDDSFDLKTKNALARMKTRSFFRYAITCEKYINMKEIPTHQIDNLMYKICSKGFCPKLKIFDGVCKYWMNRRSRSIFRKNVVLLRD